MLNSQESEVEVKEEMPKKKQKTTKKSIKPPKTYTKKYSVKSAQKRKKKAKKSRNFGYIREHEALEGRTPAEACGIKVEGKNKWITLIQNASKNH